MKTKVAILTDSIASIPEIMLQELNIHTVAYYIHRGQEVLRDLVTIQREEFLEWLATARFLPTTASPGPGDYIQAYEELAVEGHEEIVSLHMSSKGSGAYQAACVAQSMLREKLPHIRLEVIDTCNVALCQGWMAIEAARAALAGVNMEEVTGIIKKMIPTAKILQTADTLKYLYMGGRIGKAKHLMGSLLNIKPIISMESGEIIAAGIARSRTQAYQLIVDKIEKTVGRGKIKVAYVHAGAREEVEKLRQIVEKHLNAVEWFIAELSPALAVHTGKGTAGLCYYPVD